MVVNEQSHSLQDNLKSSLSCLWLVLVSQRIDQPSKMTYALAELQALCERREFYRRGVAVVGLLG